MLWYNSLLFSSSFWRIRKSAAKILKINEIYKHFTLYERLSPVLSNAYPLLIPCSIVFIFRLRLNDSFVARDVGGHLTDCTLATQLSLYHFSRQSRVLV